MKQNNLSTGKAKRSVGPILYFALWLLPLILVAASIIPVLKLLKHQGHLAPVRMTGNICMNAKIDFLHHYADRKAQTLAIGSSMGLYDLDSQLIVKHLQQDGRYLNCSAWGRSIEQSHDWLDILLQKNQPQIVILPCSLMDFVTKTFYNRHDYDAQSVKNYLADANSMWPHIKHFDPMYYLKYANQTIKHYPDRSVYGVFEFDQYGAQVVGEVCHRTGNSWMHLTSHECPGNAQQYQVIRKIAEKLAKINCRLIVIQTPIRLELVKKYQDRVDEHFRSLRETCDAPNITFLQAHQALQLDDEHFYDGTHLNQRGATAMTRYLIEHLHDQVNQLSDNTKPSTQSVENEG